MLSVNIRKQGGAAIMTIPSEALKAFDLHIGSQVMLDVSGNALIIRPARVQKKRYTLTELLQGVTPKTIADMRAETEWTREGDPVGHELI